MKNIVFSVFTALIALNLCQAQNEDNNQIADRVFSLLNDNELKTAFIEILRLDDYAIDKSEEEFPNPNDYLKAIDRQRSLEDFWRNDWYRKQSWWEKINNDISVAYLIRIKIVQLGLKNNWDDSLNKKIGKILTPYQ